MERWGPRVGEDRKQRALGRGRGHGHPLAISPLRSRAVIAASHARLLTGCGDLAPWGYKHDLESNGLVLRNQVVTWRRKGERKAYKG